ncbi:dentin matrix acidic phosphoprotein 1-like [Oenanthe melanoleuca]|uniref:dentin matrix acidic phosphoprotein 1-like n=1 Tax=Oenanthe melanoleuca TaxID=2939378 RepID=UPI0024C0FF4B|nr:dentin matrix acidic phosphoprotein 1-like [Oenanthe melanoleuca]
MRAAFLVLLLWAVACAHPVPGHEPTHPSTLQEDATNEDYMGKLGNHLDGGDGRHPPAGPETGDNALARDLRGGNAVDQELGELRGQDVGGQVGQVQHVNQVDQEDTGAHNGNDLGFLEADARDTDDGVRDHYGAGASALPSQGGGFLDEEDDSGDDTFDANGQEERGEGPTYVYGADGAGAQEQDAGPGDGGAGGGHGDSSSSSSSSESGGAERRYRSYGFGRAHGHGGASSSSQEESYDFQDEGMQGDDPSVFDGPGSSYRMRHAGPRALGNSWESALGAGSHRWEEGNSRSPEVQDGDSGEDSPSLEDNSQSEEPVDSQSEEKSSSHSREDGDGDGEDSPSREDEDSESRESTDEQQSDEEPRETPEVVRTLNEHSNSQTWEGQEDWDSAEDRNVPSTPDSESREEEGELSKSREDEDDQSQSTEDTAEESEEGESDSAPSTSAESPESPEGDSSPEDNTAEDSRSAESDNSESQEDGEAESQSQEDGSPESSSHGDDSSLQSLESEARRRRPGALRHRPAADHDDNDCQDGY